MDRNDMGNGVYVQTLDEGWQFLPINSENADGDLDIARAMLTRAIQELESHRMVES
jgi:hypothetical protein